MASVRGSVDLPQIAASSVLSFFGAKMPLPAFFMAAAIFLPLALLAALPRAFFGAKMPLPAFFAALPRAFFVALSVAFVAFVIVGFFVVVVVVATVVFVVVVIAMGRMRVQTRLEP